MLPESFFYLSPSTLLAAIIVMLSSTAQVAGRAFQTLNITHRNWGWIPLGSMVIAFTEAAVLVAIITTQSIFVIIAWGLGGTLGCWSAMLIHKRINRK